MELDAALAYVRDRHRGVLLTLKRDGRPQASNIAYSLGDDGIIPISVTGTRAKTANARRDPRVALHVTAEDFWSYVVLEGEAELSAVATEWGDDAVEELIGLYWSTQGEHPDWDDYRRAMVDDERMVLRVRPDAAYGMA